MNLKNMRECDNSKIHISSNFLLSIWLLIMLDKLYPKNIPAPPVPIKKEAGWDPKLFWNFEKKVSFFSEGSKLQSSVLELLA